MLTPLELIERLPAPIPPPRRHRHRYYGEHHSVKLHAQPGLLSAPWFRRGGDSARN
ncbi:MAG: transposase [Candidatus Accumulibacter sp.]|uniref:Transposase n=1 Tax=Candidatus Accumulibacter proximus TaxID=2954385 RepID=A0A935Q3Q1_9PROT|nr:transposase [Candidatus Accumulibacter proximus]